MAADEAGSASEAGMLIIRVWREGPAGDRQLRARLVSRRRIDDDDSEPRFAGSVDATLERARDFLEDFLQD